MSIKNTFNRLPDIAGMAGLAMLLALTGCAPGAEIAASPASPTGTATPTVTPTSYLGPTPLPAPTLIPTPGAALVKVVEAPGAAGPGITMKPQTGEPRDVVMVSGTGWPPDAPVALAWGPAKGPTGPLYWKVTADANGAFSVGLIVPPRSEWPMYLPPEFTILQLRATTPAIIGRFFWANFTYIPRPTPTVDVARVPTATVTCPTCW